MKFDENTTFDQISTWLRKWQLTITEEKYIEPYSLLAELQLEAEQILMGQMSLPFADYVEKSSSEDLQAKVAELEARVRWLETHHGGGLPADKPEGTPSEEPYGPYCWHA